MQRASADLQLTHSAALNVVFGIIVDTFGELRDEKFQIEDDMTSNCYICSIPSEEFEKAGTSFQDHTADQHNMWAYLFFMMHLRRKACIALPR